MKRELVEAIQEQIDACQSLIAHEEAKGNLGRAQLYRGQMLGYQHCQQLAERYLTKKKARVKRGL